MKLTIHKQYKILQTTSNIFHQKFAEGVAGLDQSNRLPKRQKFNRWANINSSVFIVNLFRFAYPTLLDKNQIYFSD